MGDLDGLWGTYHTVQARGFYLDFAPDLARNACSVTLWYTPGLYDCFLVGESKDGFVVHQKLEDPAYADMTRRWFKYDGSPWRCATGPQSSTLALAKELVRQVALFYCGGSTGGATGANLVCLRVIAPEAYAKLGSIAEESNEQPV
jgi:hypothetical protein